MNTHNDTNGSRPTSVFYVIGLTVTASSIAGLVAVFGAAIWEVARIDTKTPRDEMQKMLSLDTDGKIDRFLMTGKAYLDCREQFDRNRRLHVQNTNVPYRNIIDGFSTREEAVKAIKNEGCFIHYGLRPMPFCGFGDCWVVMFLVFSCAFAAA